MIYLNNAATSYPKPQQVLDAMVSAAENLPSGQFRGSGVQEREDLFSACRENLGRILGIRETGRIFFSSGATESLNSLFSGLGLEAGSVITTATEHNSVLRPLYNQKKTGCAPVIVPCDENGFVDPDRIRDIAKRIHAARCRAIILNHCSNVTGAVQNVQAIGSVAKEYGFLFILDCSQSAGCIPVEADAWGVDALAFTGHKSLLGLQGTGGHYVLSDIPFRPCKFGGTGRDSRKLVYSDADYEFEPGTQNGPGIAALKAACDVLLSHGIQAVCASESMLRLFLVSKLEQIQGIRILGHCKDTQHQYGPIVSFTVKGLKSADVSYILQNSYGILTRAGLMCAPLIHPYLGTEPDGVVRISFSVLTKEADLKELVQALEEITAG